MASDGIEVVMYRTLPKSERKVGFRFLQCQHQRNYAAAREEGEDAMNIAGLLSRLAYIEGADGPGDRKKFVQQMHMVDCEFLKDEWEKHDIYVQDTIEVECQACGAFEETSIPVDARFFSARSARPRKRESRSDS
jgi:hypothetical protein